jgi:hypothetical protein
MPEHSVRLAADPARRGERTVAAPQANLQAGAFDKALGLLVMAEAGPLDELQGARVNLLRGRSRSPRAWATMLRRCCSTHSPR